MIIACPLRLRAQGQGARRRGRAEGETGRAEGEAGRKERQEKVSYVIIMYISLTALISIIHKAFCTNFGSTSPPSENSAK
jgi:hypothetical protein